MRLLTRAGYGWTCDACNSTDIRYDGYTAFATFTEADEDLNRHIADTHPDDLRCGAHEMTWLRPCLRWFDSLYCRIAGWYERGHSREYKDAKRELDRVSTADRKAGRHYETDAYLAANARVCRALENETQR